MAISLNKGGKLSLSKEAPDLKKVAGRAGLGRPRHRRRRF
jgi:stress response protein SCP2